MFRFNKPETTIQDYGTPKRFMEMAQRRFGVITHDLAAHSKNFKCDSYFSLEKKQDSMQLPWPKGLNWLNPPYSARPWSPYSITHWSKRCKEASRIDGVEILFLVPAGVGSNWFRDNVFGHCDIYFLNGRVVFDGTDDGITIDLMLCHYCIKENYSVSVWDWRKDWVYGS